MSRASRQRLNRGFDREVNSWNSLYADRAGGRYAFFQGHASRRTLKRMRICLELIDLKPDMKVLDVGCGSGFFSDEVVAKGACWYGMDISLLMLLHGMKNRSGYSNNSRSWINGDGLKLPFKDESFDAVLCVGLINFLGRRIFPDIISEMGRVLRCNGLIVFTSLRMDVLTWLRSRIYPVLPPPISSPGPVYPIHYKRVMKAIDPSRFRCEELRHMRKYLGLPHYTVFRLRKI